MIIYKITNIVNGKCYIGQTTQGIKHRISEHKSHYKKRNSYLYKAMRKYGWENFIHEILCECDSKEELDEMEFYFIKECSVRAPEGYNVTDGMDGSSLGYKYTEEQIENLKRGHLDFSGENNPRYGDHRTYEELHGKEKAKILKDKVSAFQKNRPKPKSFIDKMSERFQGSKNPMSKKYTIHFPDGTITSIKCLSTFCKEHNLNYSVMSYVSTGKCRDTKGWKVIKED